MKLKLKKGEKSYMNLPVEVKSIDKEAGTLEAIFSTQDVDRHGDTVMQEGWDLAPFKKNPVILDSHNYDSASEVIGKASNVRVDGKKLTGKITFAVNENPKAKVIFDLYAGGYLSAFSVGFIPKAFKENKDGSRDWFVIEEAELLEVSAVSVPANARALAKSKGIDVDMLGLKDAEIEGDGQSGPEQISEDTQDAPADGDSPAGDGNSGPSGPTDGNGESGPVGDSETGASGATGPEADTEGATGPSGSEEAGATGPEGEAETGPTGPVEPTPEKSHAQKVLAAIHNLESREKRAYRKAHAIIQSLLDGDEEGQRTNAATREQVRKRKVNQAIRELLKAK